MKSEGNVDLYRCNLMLKQKLPPQTKRKKQKVEETVLYDQY